MNAATIMLLLLAPTLVACQDELYHALDERSANEVIGVLAEGGVDARKVADGKDRYAVLVPTGTTLDSVRILEARGLPRQERRDDAPASILPSATEEHLLLQRAMADDLRRSLLAVSGVVDARVNLAIPRRRGASPPPATSPRASVVLRYAGAAPPLEADDVRRIVAGAVPELQPDAVEVLLTATPPAAPTGPRVVQVGPLAVHESSRNVTLFAFAGLLVVTMLLGGTTAGLARRGTR